MEGKKRLKEKGVTSVQWRKMKKLMKMAAAAAQRFGSFPIAPDSTNLNSSAVKVDKLSLLWTRTSLAACVLILLADI